MKILFLLTLFVNIAFAVNAEIIKDCAITSGFDDNAASMKMAEATLKAHGGENFRAAKSVVLRGAVEVSAPNSAMTLPAAFSIIYAGEKYRFELTAPPIINFLQSS